MEPTTNPITDPNTTTPPTPVTQDDNATVAKTQDMIVGWAFGGSIPTPTDGQTMPAFSFDEQDFATGPANNNDPFAWGVESLHIHNANEDNQTTSTPNSEVLNAPSFDLDALDSTATASTTGEKMTASTPEPIANPIIENITPNNITTDDTMIDASSNFNEADFSLPTSPSDPVLETPHDADFWFTPETPSQDTVTSDDDFNLPDTTSPTQNTIPTTQTFENMSFSDTDTVAVVPTVSEDTNVVTNDITATIQEQDNTIPSEDMLWANNTTENINNNSTEEDNKQEETPQTDTIQEDLNEDRGDETHAITEETDELLYLMSRVQSETNTNTINVVGLRTEESEVIYTFTLQDDSIVTIQNSATNDTIQFIETESGIKVSLNDDHIAYYGVEETDDTVTHHIKEKLGKFNLMLSSELDKASQAHKEKMKRVKETLRNF